jgi:hypothetical protein
MSTEIPGVCRMTQIPNVLEYYQKKGSEKGERTWQWRPNETQQITIYRRLAGEPVGSHFHRGDDPSKNPELILLLEGVMEFFFIDLNGAERFMRLDASTGPQELVIEPLVWHSVRIPANVLYIEFRLTWFNDQRPDTFDSWELFCSLAPNPLLLPAAPPAPSS